NVTINPNGRHSVIVLGPMPYYTRHVTDATGQPQNWHLLSDRLWNENPSSVRLDFAITDFTHAACPLLDL
ncbi:MAG: hypothetical protein WCI73_10405, partial [Phycisphaerae bacterium]